MNPLHTTLAAICLFGITHAEQTAIPSSVNRLLTDEEQTSTPTKLPDIARPLTEKEQAKLDKEFSPLQGTDDIAKETEAALIANLEEAQNTSAAIEEFCKQNNISGTESSPITPSTPVVPLFTNAAEEQKEGDKQAPPTRVDADGGVYLDFEEENKIVYIRNVKVRNPEYMLDCDGELQIYFYKDENKDKKDGEDKKESETFNAGANEIKKIIAFGNVIIKFKDRKDGSWYEGKGDRLVYTLPKGTKDKKTDPKDGDLILTGNQPYLFNKNNGFLFKSWEKNGRVIYSKGKGYTSGSSTTVTREIQKNNDKNEKK